MFNFILYQITETIFFPRLRLEFLVNRRKRDLRPYRIKQFNILLMF